ncbi:hypothetical protein B9N43_16515 [Denitratisoma sp. DHT3]|uniref:M48 family metallopeptidase n=1 Tax=Denitratisoma sp. DHT3 TaxID=1981880 RepID=UPI0011984E1C|nr:M48 family metallopeptidase [Denitratisoma sp. DHT3]QDX82698.1 hypothetical protein B9N43_16515 [Denitratisoma sp. DHT3]
MRLFPALALAAFLAGCAANPISGRSQLLLVSESSAIADSIQAYQGMVGKLEKEGKISHDAKLNARVQRITDRLIDQAVLYRPETRDWAWSVKVIEDPKTINAWCMPGGKMAIYTGLIEKIKPTDDELAQIMGHEISHALLKHGAEKMSMQMAAGVAAIAIGVSGSNSGNGGKRQAGAELALLGLVLLPNSRGAESEADRIGLELAARAGFHPHAAVTLWEKMMQASGDNSRFDWLSTHPASSKRLEELSAQELDILPFYEAAPKRQAPSRAWTSTSPNERLISPAR